MTRTDVFIDGDGNVVRPEQNLDGTLTLHRVASASTVNILAEISQERLRQGAKWGQQDHADGTNLANDGWRDHSRDLTNRAAREGRLTWAHILQEEFTEAMAETDPARLRAELIQTAAVAAAWVEAIDRRAGVA